jgi:hypothetical protein
MSRKPQSLAALIVSAESAIIGLQTMLNTAGGMHGDYSYRDIEIRLRRIRYTFARLKGRLEKDGR